MPLLDAKAAVDRLAQMRDNPPSTPTMYKEHDATWRAAYVYALGDARSELAKMALTDRPHDEAVGGREPMRESEERIEEGQRQGGRHGGRWHDPDDLPRGDDVA